MDPYDYDEDNVDEMATIHESSDEEGSLYDVTKDRDAMETFVNTVFQETEQSINVSPEVDNTTKNIEEPVKDKKEETKKVNIKVDSKPNKIKPPFPFRRIPLFGRL